MNFFAYITRDNETGKHYCHVFSVRTAVSRIVYWWLTNFCVILWAISNSRFTVASGAGTAYPSGAPGFTPVFSGVRVT